MFTYDNKNYYKTYQEAVAEATKQGFPSSQVEWVQTAHKEA